ncbi:MAG: response regulator [Deferribacterota bacterium]|nr:response regulator [Deferribacterota bacterium]
MLNIVVVDDSLTIHKIVEYAVDVESYNLYKFFSLEDFKNKANNITPHLLLLDHKLEGLNLKNFCHDIKEKYPTSKIILLLGAFEKADELYLEELNVDDYINKPFNSKALSAKIDKLAETIDVIENESNGSDVIEDDNLDYEKLLEKLEPIKEKKENNETGQEEKQVDELDIFDNNDQDLQDMRQAIKYIDQKDDINDLIRNKVYEIFDNIDLQDIIKDLIYKKLNESMESIDFSSYLKPVLEEEVKKNLDKILRDILEKELENSMDNIVKTIIPDIAEKLIKKEIENIKKGTNDK